MKAIIKMELEKATRNGHTMVTENFTFKKEYINKAIKQVNAFIMKRINKDDRWIKVKKFIVRIEDSKQHVVKSWEYTPSYR